MKEEKVLTLEELKAKYKALGEEISKKEKEEAEERRIKLAAEKEARQQEIDETIDHLEILIKNWMRDYGEFKCNRRVEYEKPYLWHMFF